MSDQFEGMSRFELIHARQKLEIETHVIERRLLYWQHFVRSSAALSREYSDDDKEISRYMIDLTTRAVQRERELIVQKDAIGLKLARLAEILRPPLEPTWREMRDQYEAQFGVGSGDNA